MIEYFKISDKQKTWSDITREERVFCSELYHDIKKDVRLFVKFLNENCALNLNENTHWEIGYEVCFYRDYLKAHGETIKDYNNKMKKIEKDFKAYPPKRTFDLCLFSNKRIVIIEAKAEQRFSKKELNQLLKDKEYLKQLLFKYSPSIRFEIIIVIPSNYSIKSLKEFDSKIIYWNQLGIFYNNQLYNRADSLG